jgi:M6 family metalloprotease-like protein
MNATPVAPGSSHTRVTTAIRRRLAGLACELVACAATAATVPAATAVLAVTATLAVPVAQTAPVASSAAAEQVRSLNAQVLKLQAELRRSLAGAPAGSQAAETLAARAAALRALMETDPAAAERLAFPSIVLDQLAATFPAQAASLEQRGRWDGELEYLIEDGADLQTHRNVHRLHRSGEVLDLVFAGAEPPGLASGRLLSVAGVRSGRRLVATEVELVDAAQDGTTATASESGTAPYPATCGPVGPQSVLSVLVNLPNYKLPSGATPDFVRGVLLGNAYAGTAQSTTDFSVDDFWQQNSDGKTGIDSTNTTVLGPVTLSRDFNTDSSGASYCDYTGLGSAVIQAVDGQVDFKRFSRIQIVMPANGACTWAGVANVGCRTQSSPGDGTFTASMAWQKAGTMTSRGSGVQLSTHELGHNLGMSHSASRDFGAEPLGAVGASGSLADYGDMHSTMGSWNYGFYTSYHAANQLKWLASGANYLVVETGGTYTIQNYEGRPAGVKALKVRRGTGNEAWLWIESRQNTGLYSSRLNASLFTGALVHYQDSTTGLKSHLLDFVPSTSTYTDAALQVGQTWTDPYSNVSVTVASVTSSALTVTVNYGAVPCVSTVPSVTASPTGAATEYGSTATFNVTVKNNDSESCPSQNVDLAATAPSGWSKAFGTGSFTLVPGQTATTTLVLGVPDPYALGTYEVAAFATAPAGSGTARQSVTVIEPMNRLSLSLSGSGSVSFSSPAKTCTSSCVTDYSASTAATVTLTAQAGNRTTFAGWSGACTGTALTCTVTMNGDKSVSAAFGKQSGGGGKGGKPPR